MSKKAKQRVVAILHICPKCGHEWISKSEDYYCKNTIVVDGEEKMCSNLFLEIQKLR